MKKWLTVLSFVSFFSCENLAVKERGNGKITSEKIEVDEFSRLQLDGAFEVYLEKGSQPSLVIKTDENLMEYLQVEQRNGRLRVYTRERVSSREGIKLFVGYTEIEEIDVLGAASITNEGVLEGDNLEIKMSGTGAMELELDLKNLELSVSGAGAVELSGKTVQQYIDMSGAGGLNAFDLISQECEINISGVGGAEVYVTERLRATVSGVGGIRYGGDPTDVDKNVSGIGTISKAD